MEKLAVTQYEIHDLVRRRWSPRAFSNRLVETDKLMSLFEAARWAPSGGNQQPWSFVLATAAEPEEHARMVALLGPGNQTWARLAPVLIVAVAKMERKPGVRNGHAWYDVGQAVALLSMQATDEGLVLHQMGGFDAQKAHVELGLPEGYEAVVAIALGYPGDLAALPEDLRERELGERTRRPLESFVFEGSWEQPVRQPAL
jgi:nitroreductase